MSADAEPGPLWRAIADPDIYGQPVGTPVWPTQLAERILADPAPLLAALAEAGALTEEWSTVRHGHRGLGYLEPPTFDLLPSERIERRYVTDWTEAQP